MLVYRQQITFCPDDLRWETCVVVRKETPFWFGFVLTGLQDQQDLVFFAGFKPGKRWVPDWYCRGVGSGSPARHHKKAPGIQPGATNKILFIRPAARL